MVKILMGDCTSFRNGNNALLYSIQRTTYRNVFGLKAKLC